MKVGILGGTFDPAHLGHLVLAEEARTRLGLDRVLFVPAGYPWMKASKRAITDASHRLAMVGLAVKSNPYFEASRIDIDRPGASHTVQTLILLREALGEDVGFYFIVGVDALREMHLWREPDRLIKMCYIVAAPRPGSLPPDLDAADRLVPGIREKTILLDMPLIGISSTEIRRRVASGISIRYLVPPGVEEYIARLGLYRTPQ